MLLVIVLLVLDVLLAVEDAVCVLVCDAVPDSVAV